MPGTPEEAVHSLPPFPPAGVSPDDRNQPPPHPNAEALFNATAQHVFPEKPAPREDEGGKKGVIRDGLDGDGDLDEEGEEREEEPIMRGTPLEEMETRMLERRSLLAEYKTRGRNESGAQNGGAPLVKVPEDEEVEGLTPVRSTGPGAGKPGFGLMRDMGSVRMGASALMSALNALPWDDEEESSSGGEDGRHRRKMRGSVMPEKVQGPKGKSMPTYSSYFPDSMKVSRLHSSLHTIRPMAASTNLDPNDVVEVAGSTPRGSDHPNNLHFPFRANTIARRARSPGQSELNYQFAEALRRRQASEANGGAPGKVPMPRGFDVDRRRSSNGSDGGLSIGGGARKLVDEQIHREEDIGEEEEEEEMERAAEEDREASNVQLAPPIDEDLPNQGNVGASLREGPQEEILEDHMEDENATERKRVRKEKLSERLMEVFGLEEREEVIDEMRCWLLRSVMLKGYMYLTRRQICFFAQMPSRENLVVKTGALHKKSARTKMSTKFWVTLKNEVLSWYESTADPYFPKGNISLQYASSCDAIDDTRFKLRTSERNYTFTAESEASRDEWIKAIQKVMFKTQHEGESVKLIIPLEAVLEVEKSPTLEFAETIEIKCVDPEDQMSVDSYFFASFQDNELAFAAIQQRLDERPSSDLPRVTSSLSLPTAPTNESNTTSILRNHSSSGPLGIKKIGSVLKPFISRGNDKVDDSDSSDGKSGFSIPFRSKSHKPSHDSLETLRTGSIDPLDEGSDGYPPRQSGPPPRGMHEEGGKGWSGWIKKPATKIFGTSPSQSSLPRRPSPDGQLGAGLTDTASTASTSRKGGLKRSSVTEVTEPAVPNGADSESEEEYRPRRKTRTGSSRKPRVVSFASQSSSGSQMAHNRSDYSMMEQSESGHQEDLETAKKFRNVFSLSEKEELIDHFPGYLYRVLPVSGRFFVSTNYFCFRSSQLLYKTRMIIPIRELYGLKGQKAFRFGHSGLIVVIKGHEELFLEFSSWKRRKACIALLEERMEETRLRAESGISQEPDKHKIEMRIMEDLDESTDIEPRSTGTPVEPSPMFGSTASTFLEFKPEPMRVTCLTIGSRGDVQPYIALCKGLQAEGHTARIATHGEYKDWVEGHGIEFASVGGDPAELMQMCVDNGMFTVAFLKEGLQKFRGWLDDLLNSSWNACQGSELLIESPSAMGGIHIAEALRIPYFRAFTMPWTRTRAYPHAFAVPEHKRGGAYNYMTYTMFDQVFWRAISGQVNRWRKHVLGIDLTTFDRLEQHKVPFLYNFSPSVVPPPLDWTEWIHVTGYWFLENADESAATKKWSPPEGLLDFVDGAHAKGKKVVYIGFGSIVVSDPEEMTRCVVDAVVESGVCAILSKGWSDRGSKAKGDSAGDAEGADGVKYPDEIFSIDSIDHSWLFPRIDAACHHGGAGTSGASLRAGIPTIIKPFFGDQAFWSERVESLNVGSAVRKLTSESLAEALRKATTDEKQIAKAKIVGETIRTENGVAKAIESIYRDLEYAKSMIKPLPEAPESSSLDKVTSTLLHPLTSHSDIAQFARARSRSSRQKTPPRTLSGDREKDGEKEHLSDGSWSVVSDSGNGEVPALSAEIEAKSR